MEVPYKMLSPSALRGVIEEFVLREGTDYGDRIFDLDEKVAHVMSQLERGEVVLNYDEESETCNLVTTKRKL